MQGEERNRPVIAVMTAGGFNPWMVINALAARWPGVVVIQEQPEGKDALIRRRIRRFGVVNAGGQLATMIVSKLGKRFADRRIRAIAADRGLSGEPDQAVPLHQVTNLNDAAGHALVAALKPDVVVTVSCRILSRETLSAIPCPVINLHCAINPGYRGQMGGYWALVNGDRENFGATVHLVDAGIDTGATLHEIRTRPAPGDSMLTYPALLTAVSIEPLCTAVADALAGALRPHAPSGPRSSGITFLSGPGFTTA